MPKKRTNIASLAKQKKATPAPSAKDQKLKALVEIVPSRDEEICSGLVFKRRQTDVVATFAHSVSDDRAPSYRDSPPSASPPRDIAVQEGRGENASEEGQWDPSSDSASLLQRMLFSSKVKGRLKNLEEGPLMEHTTRQMGETLVENCLLLFELWKAKEPANEDFNVVLANTMVSSDQGYLSSLSKRYSRMNHYEPLCSLKEDFTVVRANTMASGDQGYLSSLSKRGSRLHRYEPFCSLKEDFLCYQSILQAYFSNNLLLGDLIKKP